jgi:hypothetical protein
MSKLVWDETGKKVYETGVEKGVLYPMDDDGSYANGVAWNGLTAVNESPEGAEATPLYANNKKYVELMSAEDFKGTIEAYTYPEEFNACNGCVEIADGVYATQQKRKSFGFSYKTGLGNDTMGTKYGYKLHLVYGALASPSEKENTTINDDPEAATLSWEFSTTPVTITAEGKEYDPTAHIVIDSTKVDETKLAALEAMLYGSESEEPTLPLPEVVISTIGTKAS